MMLRLLATSLITLLLLVGTLGCSKKDSAGPAMNTGSYKLDGQPVTCQVRAHDESYYRAGVYSEYVDVTLTTTPEPASGAQLLQLSFYRSSPTAAYQLSSVYLFDKGSPVLTCAFNSTAATASIASDGSLAGTFAAQEDGHTTPPPYTAITAGVFTNVHF
ncbi:hypothetical protein A8B98_20350 [Hymenobacter sp. UV11]|nr:hypothetical protein A8B98_20350 [Hymenobacter sp. UV11]